MRLSPADMVTPAQLPPGDNFLGVLLVTMAAEVLLVLLWAALVSPGPAY